MFFRNCIWVGFAVIIWTAMISCSGGGTPVSPTIGGQANSMTPGNVAAQGSSHVCWGYWDVTIDSQAGSVEIIPLRQAAFNANVTMFLQPPPAPINLLKITINPGSDLANGYVDCDITLEHPFKSLPMYRGFDVRGIFMSDGSLPVESVPGLYRATPDEARLLNADGLTRWWNASEFGPEGKIFGFQKGKLGFPYHPTATLNGYKYFADDLDATAGVETVDPATRGTFATQPGINARNYVIQFAMSGPKPDFHFQYAVDASWDAPNKDYAPQYPIEAFTESAQMREAYHIVLQDTGSTAYYQAPDDKGGELHLAVEVFDWQTPESGVSAEISALFLESPLFASPVDILPIATEMPGSQVTSRVYSVVLDDLVLTHAGAEEVLIAAESSVGTYEPNLDGGAPGFIFPDEPLVAFVLGSVDILGEAPNNPPVAVTNEICPMTGYAPLTVYLDPTGSYDPDEPADYIALFEWDINADGSYEYSNTDGAVVNHYFPDPGTYYVQLRVTDTFGASDLLDEPLEVELIPELDHWPTGFYDAQNTCYNPNSHVTPPLTLVYKQTISGTTHTQLAVGRGKIYMSDPNGYLRVFDASDGAQLWNKDIKSMGSYWTGVSPALWRDHVITGGTGIWSFHADCALEDWHVYDSESFDHQGQVIVGDTIYFKGSQDSMVSIGAAGGSENWNTYWTDQPLFPPVYGEVGGQGYIAAPYGYSFRCVKASDGSQVWQQSTGGPVYHNPVVIGDYVYFGYFTLYKRNLATGVDAMTYDLGTYQPLGIWLSDTDMFMNVRWYDSGSGNSYYKLMSFDFDLNLNWEVPIAGNCDHGIYSDGYAWLAVALDGSNMQMVAYDAADGSQDYVSPEKFSYCWGGIANANNRLYIGDNYSHLMCFESE